MKSTLNFTNSRALISVHRAWIRIKVVYHSHLESPKSIVAQSGFLRIRVWIRLNAYLSIKWFAFLHISRSMENEFKKFWSWTHQFRMTRRVRHIFEFTKCAFFKFVFVWFWWFCDSKRIHAFELIHIFANLVELPGFAKTYESIGIREHHESTVNIWIHIFLL